ncbi:MAG: response regulator [Planctomycetes bacterium]|nr:response regulator [Planctomycetota bacterium]
MGIRLQILATLGLVTLLPTGALVMLSYERTASEIEQRVDRSMQALADRTVAHLDGHLTGLLEDVRAIATLPTLRKALDQDASEPDRLLARDLLRSLLDRDPVNSVACGLLDARGRVLVDSDGSCTGRDEIAMPDVAPLLAGGTPWAGTAHWDDGAFPVLTFASSVRNPQGHVIGVLRLVLEAACLQHLLGRTDLADDSSTLLLLDQDGRVLADANSPARRLANTQLRLPATNGKVAVDWYAPGSQQRSSGLAIITPLSTLPWRLIVWQTEDVYEAPVDHLLDSTLLQCGVAAALLLLAAAVASALVAAPIQRLELAAQSIADGNLTTPIPIGSGEIGTLGRTLQQMKDRLLATMASLQEAAADATLASQVKSQFLANMSHELRTPMTAIIGYTEMLAEDANLPPQAREQSQTVLRNARHLLELVNEVLDLAKVEAGTMQPDPVDFSPKDLLQSVIELLQVQARSKGIMLRLESSPLPAQVRSDQYRVRQILLNLIGNAIKFTDCGGVTLRASAAPVANGGMVLRCEVIDTGTGIAPERVRELFQPFSQVDESMSRRHGGTGLGLAISRKIAQLLGGEIEVSSTPGAGSTFTLIVPIEVRDTIVTRTETKPLVAKLSGRILLVEDGKDNQKLFTHILRKAGAEVLLADNGLEAISALCRGGDPLAGLMTPLPCDLILMDMQMPVLDGYDATRRLRDLGLTIPIVALTAHAMAGAQEDCMQAGCDACATKPIPGKQLLQGCEEWILRSQQRSNSGTQ